MLLHIAGIVLIVLLPSDFLSSPPEPVKARPLITPLVEPLTEFTQPTPTKGKITKEIDMAALQPRERIQMPKAAPSTTQPMAQRPGGHPDPAAARSRRPARTSQDRGGGQRAAEDRAAAHQFRRAAASADGREAETGAGKRRRAAASRRLRRKAR